MVFTHLPLLNHFSPFATFTYKLTPSSIFNLVNCATPSVMPLIFVWYLMEIEVPRHAIQGCIQGCFRKIFPFPVFSPPPYQCVTTTRISTSSSAIPLCFSVQKIKRKKEVVVDCFLDKWSTIINFTKLFSCNLSLALSLSLGVLWIKNIYKHEN